jgi:uncharacterized membrane protein
MAWWPGSGAKPPDAIRMLYLVLKTLHVMSVVLFLGNIVTGFFWKRHADRIGDLRARAQAMDGISKADRVFTSPSVLLILATGFALAWAGHLPVFGLPWLWMSLALFGIAGATFGIKVGPLQKKLLSNLRAGLAGQWNESEYQALSNSWRFWGLVATGAPLVALILMVIKPGG